MTDGKLLLLCVSICLRATFMSIMQTAEETIIADLAKAFSKGLFEIDGLGALSNHSKEAIESFPVNKSASLSGDGSSCSLNIPKEVAVHQIAPTDFEVNNPTTNIQVTVEVLLRS